MGKGGAEVSGTSGGTGDGEGQGEWAPWIEDADWRTCVGKAGKPDPAEVLIEYAVKEILLGRRMDNTVQVGLEELTVLVGQRLGGEEIAKEAIENAVGSWMDRGHLFKWATGRGVTYGWSTTGGVETSGNETEILKFRKAKESLLYKERTGYKENVKDGSGNWKQWVNWVDGKLPGIVLGRYVHVMAREKRRREWAENYVSHVISQGKKEEQLEGVLRTLKSQFKNHNHHAEAMCWYGANIENLQDAAGRKNKEVRTIQRKLRAGEIYDISFRIVYELYVDLGANTDDWSQEASNRKAVALGSFMMMEFGVRVSNAVGRGNKEDAGHAWQWQDFKLVTRRRTGVIWNLQGGTRAHEALSSGRLPKGRVEHLEVHVATSKTSKRARKKKGPRLPKTSFLGRRTPLESWLLDFILEWMTRNKPEADNDLLLTRKALHGPKDSHKDVYLRDRELRAALKRTTTRLGLGADHWNTRSYRKGYATEGTEATVQKLRNEALQTMVRRGQNWTDTSKVPELHYMHVYHQPGPFGLLESWEMAAEQSLEKYLIRAPGVYDDEDVEEGDWETESEGDDLGDKGTQLARPAGTLSGESSGMPDCPEGPSEGVPRGKG